MSSSKIVSRNDDYYVEESSGSDNSYNNLDEVLDAYEKYVDQYIAFLKRASNGDASALAEYPSLMKKAEEYGDKIQNAQGNLTSAQLARWQRINNKFINAMQ